MRQKKNERLIKITSICNNKFKHVECDEATPKSKAN